MEKELTNFENWFKNLGFETNDKIDDNVLKKLIPPQRRDMWRHIMSHVLPEKEVDLIKKSIMLHKLHKRQKPLMAKVESEEDLVNALKYEELMKNYNEIQKKIAEAKVNNYKLKTNLNEQNECKKNLIKNIELKQNSMYQIKHKIEFYSKLTEILSEKSDVCNHFSIETNENLTKTDYEDSLIKCLFEIDNAKQSGIMNDSLNIGQKLCHDVYKSIKDKSSKIYIQTIEENLLNHINESNKIFTEESKITESNNDQENDFNELLVKLSQQQLKLKSKLSSLEAKIDCVIKQLKETTTKEKNEIMSQYKLKFLSSTHQELLAFEENLNASFQIVITNSINGSSKIGFEDFIIIEKDKFKMLDSILEKTNILVEETNQKRNIAFEMLKEFNDKKCDFGLISVKSFMDQLTENYLKKNHRNQINEKILCLKDYISSVGDTINKATITTTESSVLNFRTLHDIKHHSEIIDVISTLNIKFEQLNKTLSGEKNVNDITQRENMHKSEFISLMDKMETNILDLDSTIGDCKLVSDVMSRMQVEGLLLSNNSSDT